MHEICYTEYSLKKSKLAIQKELDKMVRMESDYGGLSSSIEWRKEIFTSYSEAVEFLDSKDEYYYCAAVRFFDTRKLNVNEKSKIKNLKNKIVVAEKEYREMINNSYFANHKSNLLSCKACESKISVIHLNKKSNSNICPVCNSDLRPKKFLDKANIKKIKINEMKELLLKYIEEEEKKYFEKHKDNDSFWKWLVKIEYHV